MILNKKTQKSFSKKNKKLVITLASLILIVGVVVGGTVAYLLTSTGLVENTFTSSKVTTTVEETINGGVKSDVKIKNTGDTDAYIRSTVVATWQDKAGNVYGEAPVACTEQYCQHGEGCTGDYVIKYVLGTSGQANVWVESSDGFYYYTSPVSANTSTGILISECKQINNLTVNDTDYYLTVEIIGSGIQSVPTSVVTTEWSSGVNGFVKDNNGNDTNTLSIKTNQGGTD